MTDIARRKEGSHERSLALCVVWQETLAQECRPLQECVPQVVKAAGVAAQQPASAAAHLNLISASEAFLQVPTHYTTLHEPFKVFILSEQTCDVTTTW